MYALNSAPRMQPMSKRSATSSSSTESSPASPQFPWQGNEVTRTFTEDLMAQIQQLPNQHQSLPPSFLTSFVRRCFPSELVLVDFPQALTGLDYPKDLDIRCRREVAAAMNRLDIDPATFEADTDGFANRYPGVTQWVKSIREKERKMETYYTQLHVALRRWVSNAASITNRARLTDF